MVATILIVIAALLVGRTATWLLHREKHKPTRTVALPMPTSAIANADTERELTNRLVGAAFEKACNLRSKLELQNLALFNAERNLSRNWPRVYDLEAVRPSMRSPYSGATGRRSDSPLSFLGL